MRFRIELSYMGTDFAGWQNQINATSIQELIEKGLTTLLRTKIEITGSSRTDGGVHASQQFAHFDFPNELDLPDLCYRINQILPFSINIAAIIKVDDTFHARFGSTSRAYEYRVTKVKNPFLQNLAYQFSTHLAIDQMNEACELMLKYTDFQCFSKLHTDVKTFNCELMHAYWRQENNLIVFHIKANRFLRGMVRAIVGTMLEVGLGKMSLEQFEAVLQSKNRQKAGVSVPAKGLFLVEVNY